MTRVLKVLLFFAVAYVGVRVWKWEPQRDAGCFYYAARLLWTGQDPYDDRVTAQEIARNPIDNHGSLSPGPFSNPPIMAAPLLPIAVFPADQGVVALKFLNYAYLLGYVWILFALGGERWKPQHRLLLAIFTLLLPSVQNALFWGQSSLLVCFFVAAMLLLLKRERAVAAGACLGIALAKFTLCYPYFLVLLYRRNFRAIGAALVVFLGINLLFLSPNVVQRTQSFRHQAMTANGAWSENDPINPTASDKDNFLHTTRFFFLVLGSNREVVQTACIATFLGACGAFFWLMRRSSSGGVSSDHGLSDPLCLLAATFAALTLVYHRYHDLPVLGLAAYALTDYRLTYPNRQQKTLAFVAVIGLIYAYLTSGHGLSKPFDYVLIKLGLPPTLYFNAYLTMALFLLSLWLWFRNTQIVQREMPSMAVIHERSDNLVGSSKNS